MFKRIILFALLLLISFNCSSDNSLQNAKEPVNPPNDNQTIQPDPMQENQLDKTTAPTPDTWKEIDLSKMQHMASKGRVQDPEYNVLNQKIVETLIKQGNASIPFLIEKLDEKV